MNDWREHNGGPQPVDDETWVVAPTSDMWAPEVKPAKSVPWRYATGRYRILNQHLIDAARLEGIRLGLEAAAKEVERSASLYPYGAARAACHKAADLIATTLNPATIAKEATND